MITSDMSQEEEQEYINESLSALTRSIGHRPVGWLGPEYGESFRTPQLLARAGVRYVCDWPNDEQPYPIKTPEGELVALPLMLELDDVAALAHRRVAVDRYAEMLKDGFDVMYQDGKQNGRVLGLNLHPWLIGQPFRIGFLDEALVLQRRISKCDVWPFVFGHERAIAVGSWQYVVRFKLVTKTTLPDKLSL